jgi:branched-chain amino acid transport system ATP-binding protein
MILKTIDLTRDFGSLRVVNNVNLEVPEKQIRAIIGPNGAGKSTFLDLVTNRTRPSSGKVYFKDKDITNLPPHVISKMGMGKCFQVSKLFPALTVFQNIQIALISKGNQVYNMLTPGSMAFQEEAMQILEPIGLKGIANSIAGYLSYGDQRRLEIGITLALQPTLLLLDEPTAGISRSEGHDVMHLVKELAVRNGLTIVFIEHDMDIVFNYADEISVLHQGALIATGKPAEIKCNSLCQSVYLGETVA